MLLRLVAVLIFSTSLARAAPVLGLFSQFGDMYSGSIQSIAVDQTGNIYITGTASTGIPLVNPVQPTIGSSSCSGYFGVMSPCEDVFAAKFDPTGTKLIYSTYLGPSQRNFAAAIAVDASGNAYIAGTAYPPGPGPRHDTDVNGQAFLYKLNATGSEIVYSRYFALKTVSRSLAVDSQGNAYLAGATFSLNFPTVNAVQGQAPVPSSTTIVIEHAIVMKLDPTGEILWSTLLAGSQQDEARAIALDADGNAYVAGRTNSTDFPAANPLQPTRAPAAALGFDAFISKIAADGSRLLYSTYLGGSGDDAINAIAVDGSGSAYVAGSTNYSDFPTVNAIQPHTASPYGSSFVAKIDPAGAKLIYSTYLGGSIDLPFNDAANAIVVDAEGSAWIGGTTQTADFPLKRPIQPSTTAGPHGYIAQISPSGAALEFSTYFNQVIAGLASPPGGGVLLTGPGPLLNGFIARLNLAPPTPVPGVPSIEAVYNGASFQLGDTVAPGEIVTIIGSELAPVTADAQPVGVTIGGLPAPLLYVSPGQINLQVPADAPLGQTALVVTRGSQSSSQHLVNVVGAAVGIFTANGDAGSPLLFHASDLSLVTDQNPAHAGEYLTIYATGLGGQSVPPPSGRSIEVVVDSAGSYSIYVGPVPDLTGVSEVTFQVRSNESPGAKVLYLSYGGGDSSNEIYFQLR